MSVIAFIDRSASFDATLQFAAWASRSLDQQLVLVSMIDGGDQDAPWPYDEFDGMDMPEDMYREMIHTDRIEDPEATNAAHELVQKAARRAKELGVEQVRTDTSAETLMYYIGHASNSQDLLIFARGHDSKILGRQIEEVLHTRNRVILLVPDVFSEPKSWLMALDGGASSGRAVDYLCQNHLVADVPGKAVIVGSDTQNRIHFRDAVKHLQSAGYSLTPHELQGGTDDVLAAVLQVSPVDLLVMGAYGGNKFRSLFDRSTTSRLLGTFKGPVLLARS